MIEELPQSSIENLTALSTLDLSLCINIEFLLRDLGCLRNIDKLAKLDVSSCDNLELIPELPPSLICLEVRNCENLKSIQKLPPSLGILDARDCKSLETISSGRRTPLIVEQRGFSHMSYYRFDNCQKLDQNTRQYIIPRWASLEILSVARSTRKLEPICDDGLSIVFCSPGGDIPNYFISHDPGDEIPRLINIELPSNWCDANFLGFTLCFVLDLSEVACETIFNHIQIECVLSFMTDDGDVEHPNKVPVKWYFQCSNHN